MISESNSKAAKKQSYGRTPKKKKKTVLKLLIAEKQKVGENKKDCQRPNPQDINPKAKTQVSDKSLGGSQY